MLIPIRPTKVGKDVGGWWGRAVSLGLSGFTVRSLRLQLCSHRFSFYVTFTSPWSLSPLLSHFGSLAVHFDISVCLGQGAAHPDFTLMSRSMHSKFSSSLVRGDFDFVSNPLRSQIDGISRSLRLHFELTVVSFETSTNHNNKAVKGNLT